MSNKNILIAGASVAGPALAYWLNLAGYTVTIVELSPGLRQGGNGVDVRDQAIEVAERMGIMDVVRSRAVDMVATTFVDARNRTIGSIDTEAIRRAGNNAAEIVRGELAKILYDKTRDDVEYIFGDAISGIEQDVGGLDVTFERRPARRFDLVIGADGTHSGVRSIAFGPEEKFARFKHHYFAAAMGSTPLAAKCKSTIYSEPGISIAIQTPGNGPSRAYYCFYQEEPLSYDYRDVAQQRRILRKAYANVGWDVAQLLDQMDADPDFYLDAQIQIVMPSWSNGRVALVGDAAHCASPFSGAGALLALVGTFRLAGELVAAGGDHIRGFANYEKGMRPLVIKKQGHLYTGLLVPKTRLGLMFRNGLLRVDLSKLAFGREQKKIEPLPAYRF